MAGPNALTQSLASESWSRTIRVVAVSPGWLEAHTTKDLPEPAKTAMA